MTMHGWRFMVGGGHDGCLVVGGGWSVVVVVGRYVIVGCHGGHGSSVSVD